MARQIYVNLAVQDLHRSQTFFSQLGFAFHAPFCNEKAICMKISDDIFVMLLHKDFFQGFTLKPLCDAQQQTEVLLCLGLDSRAEVEGMVQRAIAAGGYIPIPAIDNGFMYSQSFQDLDGHLWELCYMPAEGVAD